MYNFIVFLYPITLDTAGAKSKNKIKLPIMWSSFSCENMYVNIRNTLKFSEHVGYALKVLFKLYEKDQLIIIKIKYTTILINNNTFIDFGKFERYVLKTTNKNFIDIFFIIFFIWVIKFIIKNILVLDL